MQSARFALRGSNSHFQGQSLAFCQLNEARIVVGLERLELSPRWVKARHAAVTPQTQNWVCGRAFESLLHHVSAFRIELKGMLSHRVVYSHARSHAGLRARKQKKPPRDFPKEAPDRFGYLLAWVYASGATPSLVVGHGWRLVPTNPPAMAICAQSRSCRAYTCPANAFAFLALDVDVNEINMWALRREY